MSKVVIAGDASGTGTFTISAPNGNTDRTLVLPDEAGTLVTTSSLPNPLTSGTAVASTSGTAIDFTGIPSWAKRITVMLSGTSISSTSYILFQLGTSSGVEASGYSGYSGYLQGGGGALANTNGFNLYGIGANAAAVIYGSMVCTLVSGNTWIATGMFTNTTSFINAYPNGAKTTAATLDRVRITTNSGTDTFDAGSINILYE
tara:strand:+ start:32 stop:640 length:609 start_codon:yes stop_codon:yes gene_type:complete